MSKKKPIRILLIDDHTVVRAALRMVIQGEAEFKVVGEAGNKSDGLRLASEEQPDIILLDIDLGGENGVDLIPELIGAAEHARIIILTGVRDPEIHHQAVSLGAMGVVRKEKAIEILIGAIERVHAGEAWLDPSLMAKVLSEMSGTGRRKKKDPEAAKVSTLTKREREVLVLISEGLKNKEIAERLFISEWTVRHHITSIFNKLGVSDRVELILYAYRQGLVDPPR
ncbi:MAG: response regulator transcription factor [Blastocatellia bacterium]|nr:response regulator transcription factor [Blastocatellia bacterium]